MDRIEPVRRDDAARSASPVEPVAHRDRDRDRDRGQRRRGRGTPQPDRAITRDDDGTPHVDIRA